MSEEERGGGGKEGINEQRKESKNIYVYIYVNMNILKHMYS